ncbi:MAG: (Fe-S)-binding protein [Gammaproteobacteria bacterium]|nr:(Fe-S)-binding protein [Gammaproteobacteria bacterium]
MADQCVQCGLCLPHCPTYRLDQLESESPRGRIAYMKALAGGLFEPTAAGDTYLDHCLGCRRCEAACPAGVQYGALLVGSRARQAERRPAGIRRRSILALLARPRLMTGLLDLYRRAWRLVPRHLRKLPKPPLAARETSQQASPAAPGRTSIFIGCLAASYEGPTRLALLKLLKAAGIEASVAPAQGCCGAAARHAGESAMADRLASANRAAFSGAGDVLCLASGCQETLASSLGGAAPVVDAIAFLEAHAAHLRFRHAGGRRVALHIPCTQSTVTGTAPALRRLLAHVPGVDLLEIPDAGCCGAAGLHQAEEPLRAAALRAPMLDLLANCGALELLSSNIGCRLHIAQAAGIPVRHPIDFLAEHLA